MTNQDEALEKRTNQAEPLDFLKRLETIGQSSDSEVIHFHSLIRHHELLRDRLQEIILYCGCILKSLHNLTLKRGQLEDFHDQINARKNALMQMESSTRADEEGEDGNLKKLKKTIEEVSKGAFYCVQCANITISTMTMTMTVIVTMTVTLTAVSHYFSWRIRKR